MNIAIISGSIRENASTRHVALHLYHRLSKYSTVQPMLIDLTDYEYPLWKEVFHREINPPPLCVELHDKLQAAEAMIFITPEYNGGYSLALKNMVDYFGLVVFEKKAIAVSAVSTGSLGGIRAGLQLQQLILAIWGIPVPRMLLFPGIQNRLDENGNLTDPAFEKNIAPFIDDFLWYAEALYEKRKSAVPESVK